jgi:hypothetical protein
MSTMFPDTQNCVFSKVRNNGLHSYKTAGKITVLRFLNLFHYILIVLEKILYILGHRWSQFSPLNTSQYLQVETQNGRHAGYREFICLTMTFYAIFTNTRVFSLMTDLEFYLQTWTTGSRTG